MVVVEPGPLALPLTDVCVRLAVCAWVAVARVGRPTGWRWGALCVGVLVVGNLCTALAVLAVLLPKCAHHAHDKSDSDTGPGPSDGKLGAGERSKRSAGLTTPFPTFRATPRNLAVIALTGAAVYTRCTDLSAPDQIIFDEVHFGKFVNGHVTGKFYFDIHPPLVKLVVALLVRVAAPWYNGEQPFLKIGETFLPDTPVKALRFVPAVSSALLVPVTFLTCRELGMTVWSAFVCGCMVLLDTLHVAEARVLTTDTTLLLFMATSLLFHVRTENSRIFSARWYTNVALTGLFMGFTISTKWIALNVIGVVGVCTAIDVVARGHLGLSRQGFSWRRVNLHDVGVRLLLLLGVPAIVYSVNFFLWLKTTPNWSDKGPGFMSTAFQASLVGAPAHLTKKRLPTPGFWETLVFFNKRMYSANRDVGKGKRGHLWESWWYQWPLDLRGLSCWRSPGRFDPAKGAALERHVYFLGNPFVWWFAAACGCLVLYALLTPRKPKLPIPRFRWKAFMLMLGYFSGLLPYVAVRRSCFIYHYLPPLHFLVLASGLACDHLVFRYFRSHRLKLFVVVVLVTAFAGGFWFFSPMCYGTPITRKAYQARQWLVGWK